MGYLKLFFSLFRKRTPVPIALELDPEDNEALPTQRQIERRNRKRRNAMQGTRALIIDDSGTIVFALRRILQSSGYTTFESFDAESGIDMARTEIPDVIFLDIVLPGMNGFAALRLLRRDPITKNIPIIMMSSNEQATEQFFGSRIGADDFMKKPFARQEVFSRLENLVGSDSHLRRPSYTATPAPDAKAV